MNSVPQIYNITTEMASVPPQPHILIFKLRGDLDPILRAQITLTLAKPICTSLPACDPLLFLCPALTAPGNSELSLTLQKGRW
jgi:hypothetical protein